ncbi:MAG: methyltransferase family protein, partial [Flavobacteriales bacterium]
MNNTLGKIVYGSLFCLVLPFLLVVWATYSETSIQIQVPAFPLVGLGLAVMGFILMVLAMWNLWKYGNGLPMNAFKPKKFVVNGVYRFISNPIYTGACFLSLGISLYTVSAAGMWLITPILAFSCVSLVMGYERDATYAHFGIARHSPLLSYKIDNNNLPPTYWSRLSAYALMLIPWVFLYEMVIFIGEPTRPISTYLEFEKNIPVFQFSEIFYAGAYLFIALCPLIVKSNAVLRQFIRAGVTGIVIGLLWLLVLPLVAVPRTFVPTGALG